MCTASQQSLNCREASTAQRICWCVVSSFTGASFLLTWSLTVNTRLLIAGIAIGALAAGGASAHKTRHHHGRTMAYAAPAQPIPYAQLDHYLRASPKERRSIEMAAAANTGATANAAASVPAATNVPAAAASETSPGADTSVPATGAANPTSSVTAQPTPNSASDQVPSTGPDVNGNPVNSPATTPPPK